MDDLLMDDLKSELLIPVDVAIQELTTLRRYCQIGTLFNLSEYQKQFVVRFCHDRINHYLYLKSKFEVKNV